MSDDCSDPLMTGFKYSDPLNPLNLEQSDFDLKM